MTKVILLIGLVLAVMLWLQSRKRVRTRMSPSDARALLGVREDASLADIREAHRRLITKVHPDAGGSQELATRVNQARDALVEEMNRRTPRAS